MKNLFTLFSARTKEEQEIVIAGPQVSPEKRMVIILYHESDKDLWFDLLPHLNMLAVRTSNQFQWKHYAIAMDSKDSRPSLDNEVVSHLQDDAFLFLPCISAPFLTHYWQKCQQIPRLPEAVNRVYVQPIPFQPTAFVEQSILPEPLSYYEKGFERQRACAWIISRLEQKLLTHVLQGGGTIGDAPIASLTETARSLLPPS